MNRLRFWIQSELRNNFWLRWLTFDCRYFVTSSSNKIDVFVHRDETKVLLLIAIGKLKRSLLFDHWVDNFHVIIVYWCKMTVTSSSLVRNRLLKRWLSQTHVIWIRYYRILEITFVSKNILVLLCLGFNIRYGALRDLRFTRSYALIESYFILFLGLAILSKFIFCLFLLFTFGIYYIHRCVKMILNIAHFLSYHGFHAFVIRIDTLSCPLMNLSHNFVKDLSFKLIFEILVNCAKSR